MFLRGFRAVASDDLKLRVQAAGGKLDINVRRIGGGGGNPTQRVADARIAQDFLVGGVAYQNEPFGLELGKGFLIALNNHEWAWLAGKFLGHAGADASGATNDVMVFQACKLAFHTALPEHFD